MIMVLKRTKKRTFLPLNFNLANPKATNEHEITLPNAAKLEIIRLFRRYMEKG